MFLSDRVLRFYILCAGLCSYGRIAAYYANFGSGVNKEATGQY